MWLTTLQPALQELGDDEWVRAEVARLLQDGNGAMRQRQAWRSRGEISESSPRPPPQRCDWRDRRSDEGQLGDHLAGRLGRAAARLDGELQRLGVTQVGQHRRGRIVKLFGNACGAVDVSGPAGKR